MPAIQHLFIIDPVEKLNFAMDSSLAMAKALRELGHRTFATTIADMFWEGSQDHASAVCLEITTSGDSEHTPAFSTPNSYSLDRFSAIHMRKEPPVDLNFLNATWMMESVADRTKLYNSPQALRSLNEKLSIMPFEPYRDRILVSSRAQQLKEFFIEACEGDAIIKPLDMYGGKGVKRVKRDDFASECDLESFFDAQTCGSTTPRLLQPFNQAIFEGEIRVFSIGGQPISWCMKKPKNGEYLANTSAGATLSTYQPTPKQLEMITDVSQKLLAKGVVVVGFDVIGNFLSEINITSPRLLVPEGDATDYYGLIANWYANDLKSTLRRGS